MCLLTANHSEVALGFLNTKYPNKGSNSGSAKKKKKKKEGRGKVNSDLKAPWGQIAIFTALNPLPSAPSSA